MKSRDVDVCLVLEGTYPFVAGGVSSWVHHLIRSMPDLTFGILHISPAEGFHDGGHAYELPRNVIFLEEIYLMREGGVTPSWRRRVDWRRAKRAYLEFVRHMRVGDASKFAECADALQALSDHAPPVQDFLLSQASWEVLREAYFDEAAEEGFLTFFWSWIFAYGPLLNALVHRIPRAGVYHTVSTGYAGVLAAAAHCLHDRPMILTEHGIYTKERRIEIYSANWIQDWLPEEFLVDNVAPYFQMFWNRHFEAMSRICYGHADRIFTLYTDNVKAQVRDGAAPDRVEVIPNGVAVERLVEAYEAHAENPPDEAEPFTVAFVGRVCPIKDVRTFLAAMRLVMRDVPDVRVRVMGPLEEDADYAADCQRFAEELGLGDNVAFEGRVSIVDELPGVDVVVLTSVSEAQPLVVLEAGALGIPIVTTDVGSCNELLNGRTAEDRAIGRGGLLTPIASPGSTARAVLQLHADPELRKQMGESMRARVTRFYDQVDMVRAYHDIYTARLPVEER